jgi:hypothetical protein
MRGFAAGLLLLAGLVLVPFANIGIWTRRELLPTDSFTQLATQVVEEDAVQQALAARLVDELVAREPRLGLARILLEPAMREVLGTDEFRRVFEIAVTDTHDQLERGDDRLSLNLDAVLPIARELVARLDEGVANRIPDSIGLPSINVVRKEQVPQLWLGVEVTREASWVFPLLALLTLAAAVVVAERRALVLALAGLGVAFVCLVMVLALRTGRDLLSDVVGPEVDVRAFDAGYDVVTESLVVQTAVLAVGALVTAAIGVVLVLRGRAKVRSTGWA